MNDPPVTVHIDLADRSYSVVIGHGTLAELGPRLRDTGAGGKVLVVTNPAVWEAYGTVVAASLGEAGLACVVELVPPGEQYKRLSTVERVCDAGIRAGLDRRATIVALGGGVIGDLAGFAAACLYRGVRLVQVPTTLAAMVDSGIGGKTGVNSELGKNLIGAFWQPSLVLADLQTLATLPPRELRCGMAEVIKHGCILDSALFERLERELVPGAEGPYRLTDGVAIGAELARYCVQRSCELKGWVVTVDETETNQRMWLNYGHTFGHAIEQVAGYGELNHGEAVSIGMVLAARLGVRRGDIDAATAERIEALCRAAGLPTRLPETIDREALLAAMRRDKKVAEGKLRLTLLRRLGEAMVCDDTPAEAIEAVLAIGGESGDGLG